ncbi:MAG: hypothetical protein HFF50_07560 [Lawsonibacter sp.]|nr:hypothetical protein [Lawsonibacter sp.]
MKIGSADQAFDLQRIALARRTIGEDAMLMVDANCVYDVSSAIKMAKAFAPYSVTWFEEPVPMDDLDNCVQVAAAIDTPWPSGRIILHAGILKKLLPVVPPRFSKAIQP